MARRIAPLDASLQAPPRSRSLHALWLLLPVLASCNVLFEPPPPGGPPLANHRVPPLSFAERLRFALENLGDVEPGLLYRSAAPTPSLIRFLSERANLKYVIDLRRETDPAIASLVESLGGSTVSLGMSADSPPTARQVMELIRWTHRARREGASVLLHCQAGADRTGMMAGIWRRLFQGASDSEPLLDETGMFGHIPLAHPNVHRAIELCRPEVFQPFVENAALAEDPARVAELERAFFGGYPLASGRTGTSTGPLRAGVAKTELLDGWSGPLPMATYGPMPGEARGVREPVYARAIVLDNGTTRLALVSADILIMTRELRARVLKKTAALRLDDLLLAATHTHTSIGAYVDHWAFELYMLSRYDERMFEHLASKIAQAVERAAAELRDARMGWGRGSVEGLSYNRRLGTRVDPDVAVIKITERDGDPLALAVNFAAHPVLEPADGYISPDYPGLLARRLDAELGFGLFLGGALGDINATTPERPGAWAESGLAEAAAARLFDAVRGIEREIETREDVTLGSMTAWIDLPPVNVNLIPDILFPLDWLAGWLLDWPSRYPLQAMRLGDAALVATASEISSSIGLDLKRVSPAPLLLVVTHANGYAGYALSAQEHALSKLDASSLVAQHGSKHGAAIVSEARALLAAVWGEPPEPAEALVVPPQALEPQTRRPDPLVSDTFADGLRLELDLIYRDGVRGGDGIDGRILDTGIHGRIDAPWRLRFDLAAGYRVSHWDAVSGPDEAEGAVDPVLGLERVFDLALDPPGGDALRVVPRLELAVPAGETDADAPFAFAPGTGVWRPAAGAGLELTWETYRTLALATLYRTSAGTRHGRRPGDRWLIEAGYTERFGMASLHLALAGSLQLPDEGSGRRPRIDVEEASWELSLQPALSLHLGETVDVVIGARVPLVRSGSGAGEGWGVAAGLLLGF